MTSETGLRARTLLAWVLLVAGCGPETTPGPTPAPSSASASASASASVPIVRAFSIRRRPKPPTGSRYELAGTLRSPGTVAICPKALPSGLGSPPLFTLKSEGQGLLGHCSYEALGDDFPSETVVNALIGAETNANGVFFRVDRDLSNIRAQSFTPSEEAYYRALGVIDTSGTWGKTLLPSAAIAVRIALLDTSPMPTPACKATESSSARAGRSSHGTVLANLLDNVLCHDIAAKQVCPVQVQTHLALPKLADGLSDKCCGGYLGTRDDVSAAIIAALKDWYKSASSAKLILNLSLGWEPVSKNDCGSDAGAIAVKNALQVASCAGAIAVVAAGNKHHGSIESPTCPALWESEAAPSDNCSTLLAAFEKAQGTTLPLASIPTGARPLVYAAGAMGYGGSLSGFNRKGGRPRLVVMGEGARAQNRWGAVVAPLSGTSVAAAGLSALMANRWLALPASTGWAVADGLYASGNAVLDKGGIGVVADFGLVANVPVRELRFCQQLTSMPADCNHAVPKPVPSKPTVNLAASLPSGPPDAVYPQPRNPCPACAISFQTSNTVIFDVVNDEEYALARAVLVPVYEGDHVGSTFPEVEGEFLPGEHYAVEEVPIPWVNASSQSLVEVRVIWTDSSNTQLPSEIVETLKGP